MRGSPLVPRVQDVTMRRSPPVPRVQDVTMRRSPPVPRVQDVTMRGSPPIPRVKDVTMQGSKWAIMMATVKRRICQCPNQGLAVRVVVQNPRKCCSANRKEKLNILLWGEDSIPVGESSITDTITPIKQNPRKKTTLEEGKEPHVNPYLNLPLPRQLHHPFRTRIRKTRR